MSYDISKTPDLGLLYLKNQDLSLIDYSDAGYLSDPHNSKSQTGFMFLQVSCFYTKGRPFHRSLINRL
jgi:hypothetical protein